MINRMFHIIVFSLVIHGTGVIAVQAASSDPAAIVKKVINAYGGRAAVERVKVVKHTGTIQSFRLNKTGRLERLFELPDKLRVDINYPGGPHEQRLTTPEGAWRTGHPATAMMHVAMQLQAARFQLPLLLAKNPVTVLADEAGKILLGVKLSDATSLVAYVDKKSGHIVRSVGRMQMGQMGLEFIADYSDFKKVDGVLFAHRESLQAMGRPTGIAVLEKIEVNSAVKPNDFNP